MTLRSLPARFPSLLPGALLLSGGTALAQSESSDQSNSGLHITDAWADGPGSGKRIGWPGGNMHAADAHTLAHLLSFAQIDRG